MGVDPKRPLLAFALVALLCAVLMSVSVGKGRGFDLLRPGKPIASSMGGHVARGPAPAADAAEPVEVGLPVELSTQPLAVPPPAPAARKLEPSSRTALRWSSHGSGPRNAAPPPPTRATDRGVSSRSARAPR